MPPMPSQQPAPSPQPQPMPMPPHPSHQPVPYPRHFFPFYRRVYPQYYVVNTDVASSYVQNVANALCGVIYGYNIYHPNPSKEVAQVYNDYVNAVTNYIRAKGYAYTCSGVGSGAILTSVVIDHNQVAKTVCELQNLVKKYPTSFNTQIINDATLLSMANELIQDMINHGYVFNPNNCTATLVATPTTIYSGTYVVPTRYGSNIVYNYGINGALTGVTY